MGLFWGFDTFIDVKRVFKGLMMFVFVGGFVVFRV